MLSNKQLIRFISKLFQSSLLFLIPVNVWASACCGGAFSVPSIITGDDKAQLTTSLSQSQVHADVTADGVWRRREVSDISKIFKIDAAHIVADRWQAGFSLSMQTRSKEGFQGGESSGLGDISLQGAYEYLPDWDYNPIRPKGVGFLTLTLPTGKSLEESLVEDGGLSTRGRGFLALGLGTVLTKNYKSWDMNTTAEIHRSFEKTVSDTTYTPGYGGSLSLGVGWNTKKLRFGGAISWSQEEAVKVRGAASSDGSDQRYATGTFSASYLFPQNWAGTLSYSDQTLFGDPATASLAKSAMLLIQKRWIR